MRYRCEDRGTVLLCVPCENRAYHQARGSGAGVDDSCPECESFSTQLSHLCIQISDEFTDASGVAALPQMLVVPAPWWLRGDGSTSTACWQTLSLRPSCSPAERRIHHRFRPGAVLWIGKHDRRGATHREDRLFPELQGARFVLRTHVEREIHLRLTTEWSSEFARVRGEVEDVLHRGATVTLHRLYVGRTG